MSGTTIHVSGIAPATAEKDVRDFFSFCGKITSLSITPTTSEADSPNSASVTFEKEAAARTALLLDQTQLGASQVHVEAASNIDDLAGATAAQTSEKEAEHEHIDQEDKPRSRIVAEYLAHGYVVSDGAIQKAIALDQKHGFSSKFTSALANFDKKFNATERARGLDESYQISQKASTGWSSLGSYFEKALEHPTGQKLRDFYVQGDKQVRDIHNEARRLADLKLGRGSEESAPAPAATTTTDATTPAAPVIAPSTEAEVAPAPTEPKA